jgi:predicted molibdopterin-dependent oxidoreductase YjgC
MIDMQQPQGSCHETATSLAMAHDGMAQHHHEEKSTSTDGQNSSCNSCGACHLFCAGYLLVPSIALAAVQTSTSETIPYLVSFRSTTFAPLLPPPLVRV